MRDIESIAIKNEEFGPVLYTAKNCQFIVMALKPKEEIGGEVHKLDQFFRVEEGFGEAILDGVRAAIQAGFAVLVPAGTNHNIINTDSVPLKLYTLYAPPICLSKPWPSPHWQVCGHHRPEPLKPTNSRNPSSEKGQTRRSSNWGLPPRKPARTTCSSVSSDALASAFPPSAWADITLAS